VADGDGSPPEEPPAALPGVRAGASRQQPPAHSLPPAVPHAGVRGAVYRAGGRELRRRRDLDRAVLEQLPAGGEPALRRAAEHRAELPADQQSGGPAVSAYHRTDRSGRRALPAHPQGAPPAVAEGPALRELAGETHRVGLSRRDRA